ncbi:capsule assembly Wzi family protein [Hankyongella ginsenosidimutans]|uniref:Capsule assembly Wzi family protein n=1 Tax=Hankyongella ginsenosidimutans TaxID=1763828 RepID=A0A4D7BYM9_9SPHN|nr:capsule assembly Wzi family protein [Hankyongella ginsenosidimutans]
MRRAASGSSITSARTAMSAMASVIAMASRGSIIISTMSMASIASATGASMSAPSRAGGGRARRARCCCPTAHAHSRGSASSACSPMPSMCRCCAGSGRGASSFRRPPGRRPYGFRTPAGPQFPLRLQAGIAVRICSLAHGAAVRFGAPCSFSTFTRSFIAAGTENVSDPQQQPGNQLVSFDARWGGEVGRTMTGTVYAQALAEDGGGPAILPDVYSYLAGGRLSGGLDGWTWSAGIEWTDTYGVRYFGENTPNGRSPGVTYLNFIYRDGYSFKDRPIGFSLDGDSQLYSLSASITDPRNNRLSAALRRANINVTDTPGFHISRNTERLWIGEFGANFPTRWGDIAGELRYQTDQPNTPGRRDGDVQLELRWQGQF